LQLRCDGLDYKTIGQRLHISVPTVKYDMGRIYVKLNLDQFPPPERWKKIYEEYCPALGRDVLPPAPPELPEPEEATPPPQPVMDLVEADEHGLVPVQPTELTPFTPQPTRGEFDIITVQPREIRTGRLRSCGLLVGGMLLGILLLAGLYWATGGFGNGGATPVVVVNQVTVIVSPTSAPVLPSATPSVTATPVPTTPAPTETPLPPATPTPVVIVITATPAPPVQAALPNTVPGTRLKVGDPWIQDGVYLTLKTADLGTFQGTGEIYLAFDFANHTGSDLAVSFDIRNVILEASNGTRFRSFYSDQERSVWRETIANEAREDVWFYYSNRYSFLGDYFAPEVTYILVTVRNWSRIHEAVWQIDIQH